MGPRDERVWHNVRPNETSRAPRRHVFLDTEARVRTTRGKTYQSWRLGVASYVVTRKGGKTTQGLVKYTDPRVLWRDVAEFCRPGARTILWAHNLGYDVRIARVFEILPEMGWKLTAHNISARGSWLEWKRNSATLIMVDSVSVYNTTIAKIGTYFGMGKIRMDMDSEDDTTWMARCVRDVEILRTAILAYLGWLESDDMGNWQLTGSGQSWAAFRHKFLTHKMQVHDDDEALRAERRAMWAGRCEAYWHGAIDFAVVHEWDFQYAYPRIARDYSVPVRLLGPMPRGYDWMRILDSDKSALLAEVEIETELPVVPTRREGRILWPVGKFETTLWDVEIREAIREGAKVTVKRGWLYRLNPALKEWGTWIIGQLDAPDNEVPAWRKTILKHWSRALIGRMAMTYNQWEILYESSRPKVMRAEVWDSSEERQYEIMQVGTTVWQDEGRVEWSQSMPMITGYVQAIARVQLWRVLRSIPERVALYVDTDSILVTDRHVQLMAEIAHSSRGAGLRLKRSWDGLAIYGPRQIVTGHEARVSGLPKSVVRNGRNSYTGEVWESLGTAITKANTGSVVTRLRQWTITGTDHRRAGGPIGWTEPIVIE